MVDCSIGKLCRYLPLRVSVAINSLQYELTASINEIRLRRRGVISVTAGVKNIFIDEKGRVCGPNSALVVTDEEMDECIKKLTEGSLYSYDEFVACGFIPLSVGGRAGVCGKANLNKGKVSGFSEISSVNLRLHRFIPDVAKDLIEEFAENGIRGTIVCSPPAYGKTTFLRSAAYLLSAGIGIEPKRVSVADERNELAVGIHGSGALDIISGMPKGEAITLLTRTMSPEIIICDEISAFETDVIIESQNTGVSLVASAHCNDPSELIKRGRMKQLIENGVFPLAVILGYDGGYRCKVVRTEGFL